MTARKLEEVWVKTENYHGETVWKRRKKKKDKKREEADQKDKDLYVGIISYTNAK